MINFLNIKISSMRWLLPVIFLYFLAGAFQYIGVLSPTLCNFIVLFLFFHVFQFYSSWRALINEFLLLIFILLVFLTYSYHGSPFSYSLIYFYYLMCSILAAVYGRIYANKFFEIHVNYAHEKFIKISKIFLMIQMFVTAIQSTFTQSYIDLSRASIGYEDAIFGTLYLQSDAALATVCELMLLIVYIFPSKFKDKLTITTMALIIIFLGNSNAAQFVVLILLSIVIFNFLFKRANLYKHGFGLLLGFIIVFLFVISYTNLMGHVYDFIQEAQYDYYRKDEWVTAPRFAPVGEVFQTGITWIGQGPLTYYNPIDKTWLYNSGFSTFYILYFDYGLIGIILYFSYQIFLIIKFGADFITKIFLFFIFLTYTNFNFSLTDISFIFIFNFVLYLIYKLKNVVEVKGKIL